MTARTRLASGMLVAAALALTGCTALLPTPAPSPPPPTVTAPRPVIGYVTLPIVDVSQAEIDRLSNAWMTGEFQCDARGRYSDVSAGSTVDLTDTDGNVVATTTLGAGSLDQSAGSGSAAAACNFEFRFDAVTIDQGLYRIHVGDPARKAFGFTEGAIRRGPLITIE